MKKNNTNKKKDTEGKSNNNGKLYPLFVYGSLKSGNEEHFKMDGSKLIGTVQTAPRYKLIEPGKDYVGMLDHGNESIPGELYWVSSSKLKELREWEMGNFHKSIIELMNGGRAIAFTFKKV